LHSILNGFRIIFVFLPASFVGSFPQIHHQVFREDGREPEPEGREGDRFRVPPRSVEVSHQSPRMRESVRFARVQSEAIGFTVDVREPEGEFNEGPDTVGREKIGGNVGTWRRTTPTRSKARRSRIFSGSAPSAFGGDGFRPGSKVVVFFENVGKVFWI